MISCRATAHPLPTDQSRAHSHGRNDVQALPRQRPEGSTSTHRHPRPAWDGSVLPPSRFHINTIDRHRSPSPSSPQRCTACGDSRQAASPTQREAAAWKQREPMQMVYGMSNGFTEAANRRTESSTMPVKLQITGTVLQDERQAERCMGLDSCSSQDGHQQQAVQDLSHAKLEPSLQPSVPEPHHSLQQKFHNTNAGPMQSAKPQGKQEHLKQSADDMTSGQQASQARVRSSYWWVPGEEEPPTLIHHAPTAACCPVMCHPPPAESHAVTADKCQADGSNSVEHSAANASAMPYPDQSRAPEGDAITTSGYLTEQQHPDQQAGDEHNEASRTCAAEYVEKEAVREQAIAQLSQQQEGSPEACSAREDGKSWAIPPHRVANGDLAAAREVYRRDKQQALARLQKA